MEEATLGGGCFWGIEHAYRQLEGVIEVESGYSGGATENPSYEQVCAGTTGHTEVVNIQYDPSRVSYEELLKLFWQIHDPTTLNRQGPDIGTQYRSAIYYRTPEQESVAREAKDVLENSGNLRNPVVTEIAEFSQFYRAEEYHQRYFERHGHH